jgi:hypothetical protein
MYNLKGNYNNVQSVLVPKSFTKDEAIKYVLKHFKLKKLDENQRPNYWSFRQFDPIDGARYITKRLDNGILLVISNLK